MLSDYMHLAVQQALRGGPATYQNPQVGAVIVKNGLVLAQGYHHHFGGEHAEVDALKQLTAAQTHGATLFVTLEPCSHYGKQPPCCERVVQAGIAHVVIGQLDPHPVVAGRGRAYLVKHGVDVQTGCLETRIRNINRHYNWFYQHQRPWVTLKTAQTLDGKINAVAGQRSRLTQVQSNVDSQSVRSHYQAILIGERTLTTDDPQLTVRLLATPYPPARLVVLDRSTTAVGKRILQPSTVSTWLLCRHAASSDAELNKLSNVQVVVGDWTPQRICDWCAEHGWQSLLVEGGSYLQAQFVQAGIVEAWLSYVTPVVWGGTALPAVQSKLPPTSVQFDRPQMRVLGTDLRIKAYRQGVL